MNDNLSWRPCCFYTKSIPLLDQTLFKKEIRYTSTAKDWIPECNHCRYIEKMQIDHLSHRLGSFQHIPDDSPDGACVELEISFDDNCNAACLMCSSAFSTTWKKYEYKHRLHDYGVIKNRAPELLQQLIDSVPMDHVRRLFIMGGEPFYSDTHIKLIEHLEQTHPDLAKIDLWYQTNGSLFPDDYTLKKWKKFKRVIISVSIDGTDEAFEYIRWPLKWDRVNRALKRFIDDTDVFFMFNFTFNPLNILYLKDVEDWVDAMFLKERLVFPDRPIRLSRCNNPMDGILIVPELRQACQVKFGSDHDISKILTYMPMGNDDGVRKMFDYIEKHDRLRNLDWKKVFPQSVPYFTKFIQ